MKPIFGGWRLMPSKSLVDYGEIKQIILKSQKTESPCFDKCAVA